MKKTKFYLLIVLLAIAFTFLFYTNKIGLNLLIFEWISILVLLFVYRPVKLNYLSLTLLISSVISGLMIIVIHTPWTIFVNILLFLTLIGVLIYPGGRSFIHAFTGSFFHLFVSHFTYLSETPSTKNTKSAIFYLKTIFYYALIPLVILLLFLIMYLQASDAFYKHIEPLAAFINDWLSSINIELVFYFIIGCLIANVLLKKSKLIGIFRKDIQSNDQLYRIRKHLSSTSTLKHKFVSGIIVFTLLNLLILFFNITDITYVWLFEWEGGFLKEFVHEGTWILVFSVFLSALMVLFYFKGNLNFYSKNKWLKRLTYIWIFQNMFMILSVFLRNYWYMYHFGLAYKRIAVYFFLALTFAGLISLVIKIYKQKSIYYLWRVNSYALLLVLAITACINWNTVIARYNFKHYDRSFIEYRFMESLHDSALPFILKSKQELHRIDSVQQQMMPFDTRMDYFWTSDKYQKNTETKKKAFLIRYNEQNFLEWNFSDYHTYTLLNQLNR